MAVELKPRRGGTIRLSPNGDGLRIEVENHVTVIDVFVEADELDAFVRRLAAILVSAAGIKRGNTGAEVDVERVARLRGRTGREYAAIVEAMRRFPDDDLEAITWLLRTATVNKP